MAAGGRRVHAIVVLIVLVILAAAGDRSAEAAGLGWKGAETVSPIAVAPNLARCGAFPRNVEARLGGAGVDTIGGSYVVTASGCLDTRDSVLFDLEATDTYVRTGDAVFIAPEDAVLEVDRQTCVGSTGTPAPFAVAGGTGRYEQARGTGTYTLVMTMPGCAGPQAPAHLWFTGRLAIES